MNNVNPSVTAAASAPATYPTVKGTAHALFHFESFECRLLSPDPRRPRARAVRTSLTCHGSCSSHKTPARPQGSAPNTPSLPGGPIPQADSSQAPRQSQPRRRRAGVAPGSQLSPKSPKAQPLSRPQLSPRSLFRRRRYATSALSPSSVAGSLRCGRGHRITRSSVPFRSSPAALPPTQGDAPPELSVRLPPPPPGHLLRPVPLSRKRLSPPVP